MILLTYAKVLENELGLNDHKWNQVWKFMFGLEFFTLCDSDLVHESCLVGVDEGDGLNDILYRYTCCKWGEGRTNLLICNDNRAMYTSPF